MPAHISPWTVLVPSRKSRTVPQGAGWIFSYICSSAASFCRQAIENPPFRASFGHPFPLANGFHILIFLLRFLAPSHNSKIPTSCFAEFNPDKPERPLFKPPPCSFLPPPDRPAMGRQGPWGLWRGPRWLWPRAAPSSSTDPSRSTAPSPVPRPTLLPWHSLSAVTGFGRGWSGQGKCHISCCALLGVVGSNPRGTGLLAIRTVVPTREHRGGLCPRTSTRAFPRIEMPTLRPRHGQC